jgi:hypothetical protein
MSESESSATLSQERKTESSLNKLRSDIEKMVIDKELQSGNTFVYRIALVSLLDRNRHIVEELTGEALQKLLSAAIGRD